MNELSMTSPTTVRTTMLDRGAGAAWTRTSSADDRDGDSGDGARGADTGVRERRVPDIGHRLRRIGWPAESFTQRFWLLARTESVRRVGGDSDSDSDSPDAESAGAESAAADSDSLKPDSPAAAAAAALADSADSESGLLAESLSA